MQGELSNTGSNRTPLEMRRNALSTGTSSRVSKLSFAR